MYFQKSKKVAALALALSLAFAGMTQPAEAATADFSITRLAGHAREDVAKNVADLFFKDADTAIVVFDQAFADAISATNISNGKAPILYTKTATLPKATQDALKAMQPSTIYVMGGEKSVTPAVETQLKALVPGATVTRVAGRDRYEVNAKAAAIGGKDAENIVVTTGQVYSDALVAAPYAKTKNATVVLTGTNVAPAVKNYIKSLGQGVGVEVIGGTYYVKDAFVKEIEALTGTTATRISGKDRYEAAAALAQQHFGKATDAFLASGEVFSDALSASAAAQAKNAPILLAKKTSFIGAGLSYLKNADNLSHLYVMGGTNTLSNNLIDGIAERTGGKVVDEGGSPSTPDINTADSPRTKVDVSTLPESVQAALKTLRQDMSTEGASEFVNELNKLRAGAGLDPVVYDPNLSVEAAYRVMTGQLTGELPKGGQYWSGDEYYRVVGAFGQYPNLMENLNNIFLDAGGSATVTNVGLAKYNGAWGFYFGGTEEAVKKATAEFRHILSGTYDKDAAATALQDLNAVRQQYGVGAVKIDPVLQKLAEARAKESTGLSSHTRPDGKHYTDEFNKTGQYSSMGESLGTVETSKELFDGLMNHGPHAATVIDSRYTNVGIAAYRAEDGRMYWDIVYAVPGSRYTTDFQLKDLSPLYHR